MIMYQEEQSMKMEYFVVALANLGIGVLLFFAPVSRDAPSWSRWTLASVCAICGWLLRQRGTEEKHLWPLKLICLLTLIFGLFPLLYALSGENVLEVFDMISPEKAYTPEEVWNLQRMFATIGMQMFCVYLLWFGFHAQKKGRKALMPIFFGLLGVVLLYLQEFCPVSTACLFVSAGFFRLFLIERYEHF
jgi:drug/metabolite transporter (DMT)-like permease